MDGFRRIPEGHPLRFQGAPTRQHPLLHRAVCAHAQHAQREDLPVHLASLDLSSFSQFIFLLSGFGSCSWPW